VPFQSDGFTLLEILIAVFIFAILMSTVFISFSPLLGNADQIETSLDTFTMAKSCLDRIVGDLQSIHVALPPHYKSPGLDDPPDPYRIVGDTVLTEVETFSRLRLASLAHIPLRGQRRPGIAELVYYVQETGGADYVLRRSDRLDLTAEFEEDPGDPVLCESVRAFKITYLDHENESYDQWDSESEDFGYATPMAVAIALEVADATGSRFFETMVHLPVRRGEIEERR
jgi:general secretion pathway protein J